jgi:hypothetical protein
MSTFAGVDEVCEVWLPALAVAGRLGNRLDDPAPLRIAFGADWGTALRRTSDSTCGRFSPAATRPRSVATANRWISRQLCAGPAIGNRSYPDAKLWEEVNKNLGGRGNNGVAVGDAEVSARMVNCWELAP